MAVPVRRLTNSSGTLNTIMPCAACKFLRRRCAQDCPFLPYFSPNEPHNFVAVHKVFGASNVSKLLMEVPESKRVDAARSLVYEANLRLHDPIYGCMGVIFSLQERVKSLQAELEQVSSDILKHKYHKQATFANQPFGDMPMASSSVSIPASLSSLYDAPRSSSAHGDYVNNSSTSYENITYFG